jgi:putative membrane protein
VSFGVDPQCEALRHKINMGYEKDLVALDAFTSEAKDTKDMKFRAVVINGKTMVAAHKNMAYDLEKKL